MSDGAFELGLVSGGVVVIALVGALSSLGGNQVRPLRYEAAIIACQSNGGLSVYHNNYFADTYISCENGSEFTYDDFIKFSPKYIER